MNKNLIGKHKLSGFDTSIPDKDDLDCGVCFIIDDKKYQVYCNPDDGWRSYCSEIYEDQSVKCCNNFEPQDVLIVDAKDLNDKDEGIVIYTMNGKILAKIVTEDYKDWYPTAIIEWNPENIK